MAPLVLGCPEGEGKKKDDPPPGGAGTGGDETKTDGSGGGSTGSPPPTEHPRKPSWWPDPDTQEYGLKWPPPKPENWPDDKPWPPLREVGEDPQFWADLWGKDLDAERDPRFRQSGEMGMDLFRYNFDRIYDQDTNKKPGCGMHMLSMGDLKTQPTCTPFPEADVRAHCKIAFDEVAAERKCANHCLRNERRCRRSRLIKPPTSAAWRCATFECFEHALDPDACQELSYQSDCWASYICDCWEN